MTARPLSLIGVVVGAAGVATALTALYHGVRDVMVDNGGVCATGGPYAVAPGHDCNSSDTVVMTLAVFAGLAFAALLVAAADAWSDGRVGGLGPLLFFALFAALGWNFFDLGTNPPNAGGSSSGMWIGCAVLFWIMALAGLGVALPGLREYFFPRHRPAKTRVPIPLVRATANANAVETASTVVSEGRVGNPYVWLLALVAGSGAGIWAAVALIVGA